MKSIWTISKNTFKEIVTHRVLYICILFSSLIFLASVFLGQLSFQEQARVSIDFGLTATHLVVVFLSLFLGGGLIDREINNRTIFSVLIRPISRFYFLLGKALGLFNVVFIVGLGQFLALIALASFLKVNFHASFFIAFVGILLESIILISLVLLVSLFSRPVLATVISTGVFLVAHSTSTLIFLKEKSSSIFTDSFIQIFLIVIPDLERLNWRSLVLYQESVNPFVFFTAIFYCFFWCLLYLCLAQIIFLKKDVNSIH